jgi:hypothetical protein
LASDGKSPGQQIMAISGSYGAQGADFLQMAKQLGADEILAKPFDAKQLVGKVETCLAD